jgi:hypothetical protein
MMIYKIITLFFSLSFFSCGTCKEAIQSTEKIQLQEEIQEVYFQGWVAGVRGGGAGIGFYVNFKNPLKDNITLEKVHFRTYEASFNKVNDTNYIANINTGQNQRDEILVETDEKVKKEVKASNINLKGNQAILFFKKDGKLYSKTIEDVKEKEMIAYPSMRRPTE